MRKYRYMCVCVNKYFSIYMYVRVCMLRVRPNEKIIGVIHPKG